jgi:hypothetical protein
MSEQEFESLMAQAENVRRRSDRPGYYEGYMRGLRRFYHGGRFGTLQEHETWLDMAYHWDQTKADRGRGYQDGLQGVRPRPML